MDPSLFRTRHAEHKEKPHAVAQGFSGREGRGLGGIKAELPVRYFNLIAVKKFPGRHVDLPRVRQLRDVDGEAPRLVAARRGRQCASEIAT